MVKYLVAVSGGVDSVVLLDMLSRGEDRLVVAHVDHGIRGDDSSADARFVEALAKRYKLPFVSTELHLDSQASEEQARQGRYDFLFAEATKFGAVVATAHHRGDVVETVAINLERGTGWRGLAVLARPEVHRPLLGLTKDQLYRYALKHRLEWVEDSTNRSDAYQRNRLRRKLSTSRLEAIESVARLRSEQLQLRHDIDHESRRLLAHHSGSRYFLSHIDDDVAIELLGAAIADQTGIRPQRPQLVRALHAVKTAKPGTKHDVGDGVVLKFTPRKYDAYTV